MRAIPDSMKDLPTYHGLPIPYVAEWSSETEFVVPPPVDLDYGMVAVTKGMYGYGEPLLGAMQPQRQRECMTERICQVCHTKLGNVVFMAGGNRLEWFTEPPCCLPCMRFAVQVCPGLVRGSRHRVPSHRLRIRELSTYALAQARVGIPPTFDVRVEILMSNLGGITPPDMPQVKSFRVPIDWTDPIHSSMLYFFMGSPINPKTYTVEEFLAEYA
jgi:hypothetical protein